MPPVSLLRSFKRLLRLWAMGLAFLLGLITVAQAASGPLMLTPEMKSVDLGTYWSVLRDPGGKLTLQDIIEADRAKLFQPIPGDLAAGYTTDALWLRVEVIRRADSDDQWWLELDPPFVDRVVLYAPSIDGDRPHVAGRRLPLEARDLASNYLLFGLSLPEDMPTTLYIRLESQTSLVVHGKLLPRSFLFHTIQSDLIILSILFGSMLLMTLISATFALWLRGSQYLPFAVWTFASLCQFAANTGMIQVLLPDYHRYSYIFHGLSMALNVACGAWMGIAILDSRKRHRWIHIFFLFQIAVGLLVTPAPWFDRYDLVPRILNPVVLISLIISSWGLAVDVRNRIPSALTYLIGFGLTILITMLVILRNMGIIPNSEFLAWGYVLAAPLYMGVVSVGLANGVRWSEKQRALAQAALLEASRQSEQQLAERVSQRTHALENEIQERRQAEKLLRDSEMKFRNLVESAPIPILVAIEPEGYILFANPLAESLLKPPVGQRLDDLFPNDGDSLFLRLRRADLTTDLEVRHTMPDGEVRWLLLSGIRMQFDRQDAVMISINDFTEHKRVEINLRDARTQAEAALMVQKMAMTEQRDFLAMVSHEFRTPLGIITASAEFVELDLPSDDEQAREEVDKIRRACQRMLKLVESCLSDEWLESMALGRASTPLNLTELVKEAAQTAAIGQNPLRLFLPPPDRLPPMVDGDPALLSLMLGNLIENAGKYSNGFGPIDVALFAADTDLAVIEVSDRGPGIPESELERIFDKYYRLPSTQAKPGAGLGLYLVRRILNSHFGTIRASLREGGGTTFTIALPLRQNR